MRFIKTSVGIFDGTTYLPYTCTEICDKELHDFWMPDVEAGDKYITLPSGFSRKVLKETNNIEEVTDEFDIIVHGKHHRLHDLESVNRVLDAVLEEQVFIDDTVVEKVDAVYAAIWTDIGLIYFAKMNEKRDWDLIKAEVYNYELY